MGWLQIAFNAAPRCPGLYAIYECDRLVYVGKSVNLLARLRYHRQTRYNGAPWRGRGAHTHFNGINPNAMWVKVRVARPREDWHRSEERLIARLQPPLNRKGVRPPRRTRRHLTW